jgi:hypothetical protein
MRGMRAAAFLVALGTGLAIGVAPAAAHQTLVNNGVAVTLHVAPNDEPISGQQATVSILSIKTGKGKFTWATCACTMKIFEPDGSVLLDGRAARKFFFTFPEPRAYGITVAGRVLRKHKWAKFTVTFGIRAD